MGVFWQCPMISTKEIAMQARNHVPFAMATFWLFAIATDRPIDAFGTMAAAIGGLLPDLDHPESVLGRRVPIVSVPLARLFGHRGMTHSLFAVVILLMALVALTTMYPWGGVSWLVPPLIIGYLSHILGDSMTPSGVPLFWPRKRTYSFNLFKTWSWQETASVAAFTFIVVLAGDVSGHLWQQLQYQLTFVPVSVKPALSQTNSM